MMNTAVRDAVMRVLPRVKTPAQYIGGELNSHRRRTTASVRGKLCLCFPGRVHDRHEPPRLAGALHDHEQRPAVGLRAGVRPVARLRGRAARATGCRSTAWRRSRRCREFDVLGFSLQYEVCYTNLLTMLDLGGIPHFARDRTRDRSAGHRRRAGAQNPELLAPFVDLFVIGDGEEIAAVGDGKVDGAEGSGDPRRRH